MRRQPRDAARPGRRLPSVVYPLNHRTADSPSGWGLRCLVSEGLVQFIQEHYPETHLRVRAEVLTRDGARPETVAAMGR